MDRQQFCELLLLRKDELGLSLRELTIATHFSSSGLLNLLHGQTNVYVESAIKLADVLGYVIVVKNEKWHIKLNSQTALTWWAQESIQAAKISVNKFKDKIGMSRVAVTANLKGEYRMRIDTLFKWAEITGYQVEVWQK